MTTRTGSIASVDEAPASDRYAGALHVSRKDGTDRRGAVRGGHGAAATSTSPLVGVGPAGTTRRPSNTSGVPTRSPQARAEDLGRRGRCIIHAPWARSSMAEQLTLNQRVEGSSPSRLTTRSEDAVAFARLTFLHSAPGLGGWIDPSGIPLANRRALAPRRACGMPGRQRHRADRGSTGRS